MGLPEGLAKQAGPAVKSDSNEIGIEELVIVHEYIVRGSGAR